MAGPPGSATEKKVIWPRVRSYLLNCIGDRFIYRNMSTYGAEMGVSAHVRFAEEADLKARKGISSQSCTPGRH